MRLGDVLDNQFVNLFKIYMIGALLILTGCGKATEFEFSLDFADGGAERVTSAGDYEVLASVTGGGSTWPAFTAQAKANCGGSLPKSVEVQRIALDLVANNNAPDLADIFSTDLTVFMTASLNAEPGATRTTLGTRSGVSGRGPILFRVVESNDLKSLTDQIVNGNFVLGLRGPTTRSPSDAFSVKLRVTLNLVTRC